MSIVAIAVFLVVILLIMTEKVHRTTAAWVGAVVLLLTGVLDFDAALSYIDFNTLGVLIGMMAFVAVVRKSGLFEYVAIKAAKLAKGDPWKIMIAFTIVTALLSGVLDNVTTVLLVGPMTITIAQILEEDPVPFLLPEIFASNVGGTATLIGDPPNIMIGSAAGLSFMDFLTNTGFAVVFIMIGLILFLNFRYKKNVELGSDHAGRVMSLDENKSVTNWPLLKKSIIITVLVIFGFIFHDKLGVESSVIALTAAGLILLIGKEDVTEAIQGVEWTTILFFASLFVVVGGLSETGVIDKLANVLLDATAGHPVVTMMVLLWASAFISSVLDNIPFIATLIPLVLAMGESGVDISSLWWAISLGVCLGGNGTLIGASANVVLSDISTRHGYPITFQSYLKVGMPFMILSICISTVYVLVRYVALA